MRLCISITLPPLQFFFRESFIPLLKEANALHEARSSTSQISTEAIALKEKIEAVLVEKMAVFVRRLDDFKAISDENVDFLEFYGSSREPQARKEFFCRKVDRFGRTLLMKATETLGICQRVAHALIDKGANIYEINQRCSDRNPLHLALEIDNKGFKKQPSLELISHLYEAAKKDFLNKLTLCLSEKMPKFLLPLIVTYRGVGDFFSTQDNRNHTPLHAIIDSCTSTNLSQSICFLNFILEKGG